jgi:hypothetical protein
MGTFGNLKTEGLEESGDRLGGFSPVSSDIYVAKIKMAYADKAASGAQSVTIVSELGGREYEETIYVTNAAGENFYRDKTNKTKKHPLMGFTLIDDICLVVTGKPLSEQDDTIEEKMVSVYDKDAKGRIPKSKPVLTALIGGEVALAIFEVLENKQVKGADDKYVDTAETRTSNSIDKVFDVESKMTVAEARHDRPAEFWDAWIKQNKGIQRDKRNIKDGQTGGAPGATQSGRPAGTAPMAGASAPPKRSLFGAKKSEAA